MREADTRRGEPCVVNQEATVPIFVVSELAGNVEINLQIGVLLGQM